MIIVKVDGEERQINGRVEAAIRYLIERAQQISVMRQGSVELHFSGSKFRPSIHDLAEEINVIAE